MKPHQEKEKEIVGVLYKPSQQLSLQDQVQQAVTNYSSATHTKGTFPAEAHFNPEDLPDELEINGLTTIPDPDVRSGYIRITSHTLSTDAKQAYKRASTILNLERFAQNKMQTALTSTNP
jgi:hypothetical protein